MPLGATSGELSAYFLAYCLDIAGFVFTYIFYLKLLKLEPGDALPRLRLRDHVPFYLSWECLRHVATCLRDATYVANILGDIGQYVTTCRDIWRHVAMSCLLSLLDDLSFKDIPN